MLTNFQATLNTAGVVRDNRIDAKIDHSVNVIWFVEHGQACTVFHELRQGLRLSDP